MTINASPELANISSCLEKISASDISFEIAVIISGEIDSENNLGFNLLFVEIKTLLLKSHIK